LLNCDRYKPKPPKPPEPPEPKPIKIKVQVCKESGLIPNPYCPEVIEEEFEIGDEPREVCSIHHAPEPKFKRYVFAADIMTAEGDWKNFLRQCAEAKADGIRMFAVYGWFGNVSSPWKQIGTWHADYDDAPELPFYDLRQYDEKWWQKFREILCYCRGLSLEVIISLDDFCSLKLDGWEKYWHPVLSSAPDRDMKNPGVNRFPNGYWGIGDNTIEPFLKIYRKDIISEIQKTGVKYWIETMNEYDALDWPDDYMIMWHDRVVRELIDYGVPRERIIASPGRCWQNIAGQVGILSIHCVVKDWQVPDLPWPHDRVMISGDGGYDGSGRANQKGGRGLGLKDVPALAKRLKELGYYAYEYMDQGMYFKDDNRANLDDFDPEPLIALYENSFHPTGSERRKNE